MATFPRMNTSKHGASIISSPFSTSPRKLQEMSLPASEAHDVTSASCVSMKQYEEQLNGLRKENFHLKLRIYFLEEKLGTGAPPAVQGLLEHNVRLQVEVEELRKQLSDKQELLAAAAEAIDVLENQGSISTEVTEVSLNHGATGKDVDDSVKDTRNTDAADETYQSESAGDYLAVKINNKDLDKLTRLKKENRKALHMLKGCMKKIQQQDEEIKKLKLDKEQICAHVSDSQVEKHEEILKSKTESKVELPKSNVDNANSGDSTGNLQELLTRRLQGLAYFLDKLLSHKCVLGEDNKKLAESILEQSLALPVGLKLDGSMVDEFTLDESNFESFGLEDLTMMFGHHLICSDGNDNITRRPFRNIPQADMMSESECWSEPDRNVSLARVGLCDTGVSVKESISDNNRQRLRRSKVSYGSRSEDNKESNEKVLMEHIDQISKLNNQLEQDKKDLRDKLELALKQIDDFMADNEKLKAALLLERGNTSDALKNLETMKHIIEKLREEKQEMENTYLETERSLRRAADEATVQASQAALERARAQHDRLRIERELEETREKLSAAMETNAQLEMEVTRKVAIQADHKVIEINEGFAFEEDRPTSPDQGIDSDRLSSLEQNEALNLSPRLLYEENITLKQKLARTKATLAETLTQLNAANMRKRNVQRAICREIHKTQGVLRQARDHFDQHNQ